MALLDELNERYTKAMKAREEKAVSTLRMVRARIGTIQNDAKFDGKMTDEIVRGEIAAYVKQLRKALPDYEKAGDAGAEAIRNLQFEIEYLSEFLPSMLDESETRALVRDTIATLGITDPKRAGQVMGAIMKENKGRVDPGLVRQLVDQALNAAG